MNVVLAPVKWCSTLVLTPLIGFTGSEGWLQLGSLLGLSLASGLLLLSRKENIYEPSLGISVKLARRRAAARSGDYSLMREEAMREKGPEADMGRHAAAVRTGRDRVRMEEPADTLSDFAFLHLSGRVPGPCPDLLHKSIRSRQEKLGVAADNVYVRGYGHEHGGSDRHARGTQTGEHRQGYADRRVEDSDGAGRKQRGFHDSGDVGARGVSLAVCTCRARTDLLRVRAGPAVPCFCCCPGGDDPGNTLP